MATAQGISKITVVAKQAGLGVPNVTASAGQILRRVSSVGKMDRATFTNNEINPDQQDRGISYGNKKPDMKFSGLLSASTYKLFMGSIIRQTFVAGVAATAVSITIAGAGPSYTVTRGTGSYLTDGFKIGDVIRLSVGVFNASNINKNLLITGLTATVATVVVLNATAMVAEGPIATSTVTVFGKKAVAPVTGQTNDYYTIEEYYSDITKSDLFTDMKVNKMDIKLPGSGNCTIDFELMGLARTINASQQMATPSAVTTNPILTSVNGDVLLNGTSFANATAISISVEAGVAQAEPVIGSNVGVDLTRGVTKVSGSISGMFTDQQIQTLYQSETPTQIVFVASADQSATSDFISLNLWRVKFTGDAPDDGQKLIVRTYPFTAEYNAAGGAGTTTDQAILSIQDSAA
jgi:hypothetical protein